MKSGRCSYCGTVIDVASLGPPAPIAPELLIALEPRERAGSSPRVVWARRFLAFGAASFLLALFARACMRS